MSNNKIQIYHDIAKWFEARRKFDPDQIIGFVPTMGALHAGHLSLIRRSVADNDITIVSIYVNPTQFNDQNDLNNYPIDLEQDIKLLQNLGVDYVLCPKYEEIYHDNYRFQIREDSFSKLFCGKDRPGHFDGVLTVVMKLFNLVRADKAYFGEKDYQQLTLIKDMVSAFFMGVEIIACPTMREEDGLAMSSRNRLLNPRERKLAPKFNQILKMQIPKESVTEKLEVAGFKVDYVEDYKNRRWAAVRLGNVRLIDNEKI